MGADLGQVPAPLAIALADRYQLVRELGSGGMATVYLARDLKHDRDVALKVLRPDIGAVLGAERFLAEIKITAQLDHPHILTLIDSGAIDGFLFYVLPFVHGESLRDKLNRETQLGVDEALLITKQIASALDYAHHQGVVHRDIKPENILLHEGEAMLADFGIALAVKEAGGHRLTETGISLGTPQYMSPEQATGDRQLDARSDVYSLGAVLYEMLAGEPPVTGPTAQAMIAKLLTERPTRLRVVRDTVPEGVEAAVAKALAKTPADRFASAGAFADAARKDVPPAHPGAGVRRSSLAWWFAAAGILVTAGALWLVVGRSARRPASSPFATAAPIQLTTSGRISGLMGNAAVASPDGSQVAYAEQRCDDGGACRADLVIRETAGEGFSTIVSQPGHRVTPMSWSPDGRWVAFVDQEMETGVLAGLYVVSQRGGIPRRIVQGGALLIGGFVAPDTLVLTAVDSRPHWLTRVVASTGVVVDSVALSIGRFVVGAMPSPDGSRLLILQRDKFSTDFEDSLTVSVIDRSGRTTDSLRLFATSTAAWAGMLDAVVFAQPRGFTVNEGTVGTVFVRRRLDGRSRFLPGVDTLKAFAEGSCWWLGVSADGTQLFYQMTRLGETSLWTATRADARGAFVRGRKIGSSTGSLMGVVSRGGRWIRFFDITTSPAGPRTRLESEPFAGGARQVLAPAHAGVRAWASAFRDDSLIVATDAGSGRTTLTTYPLPSGTPVQRGTFDFLIDELEELSDGRLIALSEHRRVIRLIGRQNDTKAFPVPDSLGEVMGMAPSPSGREWAIASFSLHGDRVVLSMLRFDPDIGRYTVVAQSSRFTQSPGWLQWTTDDWLHLSLISAGNQQPRLYRVPAKGGVLEAEPPIGFESTASVGLVSRDGRRAVVTVRGQSTDLWVLRAAKAR